MTPAIPSHLQGLQYLIPVLVILPMLYFRLRRMMKPQKLKLKALLIRPAIIVAVAAAVLGGAPPALTAWPWLGLAAVAGAVGGWQWGHSMAIHVEPKDGTLMTRGGQAAMIVLALLLVLRVGLKAGLRLEAASWHLDAVLITDASIVFSALLFAVRGLEMFLRARKVLAQHAAAGGGSHDGGGPWSRDGDGPWSRDGDGPQSR